MFLKYHLQSGGNRLLKRSFTLCQTRPWPPPQQLSSRCSPAAAQLSSVRFNATVSKHQRAQNPPSTSPVAEQELDEENYPPPPTVQKEERQFIVEDPDRLLAATITPELEAVVLADMPNGEFALKKLLAELQSLQTKKSYPLPLPEYLTVG